jgi:sugar lactone lactonase YvrE
VQWNHYSQTVWWTDIKSAKLYCYNPGTKNLQHWNMPEPVACFAFVENDSRMLIAFASGIAWFDIATSAVEWISLPESELEGNALNDGRVDRQGRFWVGSIVEENTVPDQAASLYCLDTHQQLSPHLTGLTISNGLCWSLDSRKLYHTDSPTRRINIYDFDPATGTLANGKLFAEVPAGVEPDGACVDAHDFVWSAQFGGGDVLRFAPDGREDCRLELPVTQPTCVAFGGVDMDLLFVTSARKGLPSEALANQPFAGNLFIYRTDTKGVLENWYRPQTSR